MRHKMFCFHLCPSYSPSPPSVEEGTKGQRTSPDKFWNTTINTCIVRLPRMLSTLQSPDFLHLHFHHPPVNRAPPESVAASTLVRRTLLAASLISIQSLFRYCFPPLLLVALPPLALARLRFIIIIIILSL